MKLTLNFTLEEMLESNTARENNFFEQWTPPADIIENLRALCVHLLQPLRDALGNPIVISVAYRCPRTNVKVGGVSDSWHLTGEAADCEYYGPGGNQAMIDKVKELYLPFDQMIDEDKHGVRWIHLSYGKRQCRRQMLRMIDGKYEVMV